MKDELLNITSNSENPLKAAHAYLDISDGVNSIRNAIRDAKVASDNALELVCI